MIRKLVPTIIEAIEGQQRLTMEKLLRVIPEEDIQKYKRVAEELLEENDSVTLLSAALKMLTKEPETSSIQITEPAPPRVNNVRKIYPKQNRYRRNGFGPKSNNWSGRGKGDVRGSGATSQESRENKRKG
jgi:ATP-dependent RNA helicase DeaD